MFGYILPEKPELKIREYELFRAYYCGVCKSIGKRYGLIPRMTLNYDSTFLALLLSSFAGEKVCAKRGRCIAHPVSKRLYLEGSSIIDYASDMNILLAYYKMEDDWRDEHSPLSAAGMLAMKRSFKKNWRDYREKCGIIKNRLAQLNLLEKQKCASMDEAAEPFAKLMEEITAYGELCSEPKSEKLLRWIGYNIGRWIYILDAFDDMAKDAKNSSYNPLLCQFGYTQGSDMETFKGRIRDRVEFSLTCSLNAISQAYELMDMKCNKEIIENIIYMGMLRKTEQILGTGSCMKLE